jgi:uncharacterized protein YraI
MDWSPLVDLVKSSIWTIRTGPKQNYKQIKVIPFLWASVLDYCTS